MKKSVKVTVEQSNDRQCTQQYIPNVLKLSYLIRIKFPRSILHCLYCPSIFPAFSAIYLLVLRLIFVLVSWTKTSNIINSNDLLAGPYKTHICICIVNLNWLKYYGASCVLLSNNAAPPFAFNTPPQPLQGGWM